MRISLDLRWIDFPYAVERHGYLSREDIRQLIRTDRQLERRLGRVELRDEIFRLIAGHHFL